MSTLDGYQPAASVKHIRRNERLFYLQLVWVTPFVIITGQYMPVLVTRLGATPLLLGLLTSGSALALTSATILARWYLQRAPSDMRTLIVPTFISRLSLMLIPLVLMLPTHQAEALVLVGLVINVFIGIVQVTFYAYLPRVTRPERVAVLMGGRWMVLGITMTIGTPLMAVILDHLQLPANYALACGVGVLAGIIEIFNFASVRLLPAKPKPRQRESAIGDLRLILKHRPAARFLAVTLAAQLALNAPAPLIPLKLVRELGASDTGYGWYVTVFWLSIAIMGVLIPRLVQRWGNRRLFALAGIGVAAQMVILGAANSLPLVWMAGAVGGMSTGLLQITSFGQVIENAPPDHYESYVSIQLSVMNFTIFAAPLVMSGLLSGGLPIGAGLLVCAAGNIIASALSIQRRSPGATGNAAPTA